jgi:hypothetical protein
MEAGPILHEEPVPQVNPVPRPAPVMPPEPMFHPESASAYHASPAAPDPRQEPNDDANKEEPERQEEPWEEIALEIESGRPFHAGASEDSDTDAPGLELAAESIDLAAFVKELSDSLLAAAPGAGSGQAAESDPSIELEPIPFEHAVVEDPTAGSEREVTLEGLDGLADDQNPDDAELWVPLAAVVGRRWSHIEGEAAQTEATFENGLLPPPSVAVPGARPAAPAAKTGPSRRGAAPEVREPRKKKRQKAAPAPTTDDRKFFDPDECGFASLIAKLDEVTAKGKAPVKRRA